jgi:biotin carboxyl carrier protein
VPETLHAPVSANVDKILVRPGDAIEDGSPLIILASMNREFAVMTEVAGVVIYLHVAEGDAVRPGQPLVDLSTE